MLKIPVVEYILEIKLFISFLKLPTIGFIADNNLAGVSHGNYCRSEPEKHITLHSGDNN